MGKKSLSDQIRKAVATCGESRYSISKATGIDQSQLSRFVAGKQWLSEGSFDRLAEHVGIKVAADRQESIGK